MKRYNYITLAWAVFMLAVMLFPKKNILIKESNVDTDTEDYVFDVQVLEDKILFFDKSIHILLFGVLGFLLMKGIQSKYIKLNFISTSALTFLICVFYGFLIECVQFYIPGRSFEFNDIIADAIGGLFGILFFYYYNSKSKVLISSKFN